MPKKTTEMEEPQPSVQKDSDRDDVQKLLVIKEELLADDEEWRPKTDQEDQYPLKIKEEQEEGEITGFIFHPFSVKSEDEKEKPQLSELHHSQIVGPRPDQYLQSYAEDKTQGLSSKSSEMDVSDGNWEKSSEGQSGLGSVIVKSEEDEEKPLLSDLHHGQPEQNRDSLFTGPDTDKCLKWDQEGKTSDSETDVSDGNWEENIQSQSGLDSVNETKSGGRYRCSECAKTFSSSQYLSEHHRIHTGVKPFICSVCSRAFRWRNGLVRHMKTHSGEKPFSCSECSKAFSSKKNLMEHTKVHSGERPYSCSNCDASFKRAHTLKDHLRTHTGERPHKCSICSQSFRCRSHLVVHVRGHAEEKPFSCPTCNATFKRKVTLEEHIRTHTGEKPYICSQCGKSYVRYFSLSRHMRCHTGERPYSCSTCQATFRWRHAFVNHAKIHVADASAGF